MKIDNSILMKLSVIALLPLFISGCLGDLFEQDDRTYNDEQQVEFNPTSLNVEERGDENEDPPVQASSAVNLISQEGTAQSDLEIEYTVDDSSTAVEGDHYNLVSSSPLTIPEGETTTELEFEVTADNLDDDEVRVLYISLQGGDNFKPAANYRTLTVNIQGVTD